jgi:sugar/nucleoside kinase (ribokinase family)
MEDAEVGPRVLVVGDANVDLILRGDVVPRFGQAEQLLDSADLVVGGSASIFAIGLARLGVATSLVSVVGADRFGAIMRDALAADAVNLDALITDPDVPTGISVILSAPGDRSILTMPGTVPLLRASDVRAAVLAQAPVHVHFASYFLLPGLAAELPELLGWLRGRDITTSLDTNWDPAEEWAGLDSVIPLVDVLLPNREELRAIAAALGVAAVAVAVVDVASAGVGAGSPPAAEGVPAEGVAAEGLAAEGVPADDRLTATQAAVDRAAAMAIASLVGAAGAPGPRVVVKAGSEGGWSVDAAGNFESAPSLTVDVVDTTGAGDSFDAGYIAARIHGIDTENERLRWAAAAGSLSTLGAGGTSAQPTLDALREQLDSAPAPVSGRVVE